MLHEGSLGVVDVVSESRLQGVVNLAILIQLVYDQFMHYVDVERRRDLEAKHSVAVFQSPNDLLVRPCGVPMRHPIGWQIQAQPDIIYGVDVQLTQPRPSRVRFIKFLHKLQ